MPTFTNPIPIGTDPWGVLVNDNFEELMLMQAATQARDHNLITWAFDPATNLASTVPTSGTVQMSKVLVRKATTITNVIYGVATLGTTLTAGQNFAGLYNASGTRIGVTADQTTAWGSGALGAATVPLTAPVAVTAGAYWVAFVSNGTTPPAFARGSSAASGGSTVNIGLTAATGRYTTGPAAQTSLPASVTMASRTLSAPAYWVAVS